MTRKAAAAPQLAAQVCPLGELGSVCIWLWKVQALGPGLSLRVPEPRPGHRQGTAQLRGYLFLHRFLLLLLLASFRNLVPLYLMGFIATVGFPATESQVLPVEKG